MEKKNFFEEVALACKDDANKVRQAMYFIMHSEEVVEKSRDLMVESIVSKFIEKIDNPKLLKFFNSKVGYKDRDFSQPAENTLIYELISDGLSFPQKEKGFSIKPVGHYFKEGEFFEIYHDFELLSRDIAWMNERNFGGRKVIKLFKGPDNRGGKLIELYFEGGQCLVNKEKIKIKNQSKTILIK